MEVVWQLFHIDPVAFVFAVLSLHILGGFWYAVLLREKWQELVDVKDTDVPFVLELKVTTINAIAFTLTVIGFTTLFNLTLFFVQQTHGFGVISPLFVSLGLALGVWFFLIVPTGFLQLLFAKKPLQLWLIDSIFWLLVLLLIAIIIGIWQ